MRVCGPDIRESRPFDLEILASARGVVVRPNCPAASASIEACGLRGVAQPGRALRSGPIVRRFKSCGSDHESLCPSRGPLGNIPFGMATYTSTPLLLIPLGGAGASEGARHWRGISHGVDGWDSSIYQMRARSFGWTYSLSPGCTLNASYQASMFRTTPLTRYLRDECGSLVSAGGCSRPALAAPALRIAEEEALVAGKPVNAPALRHRGAKRGRRRARSSRPPRSASSRPSSGRR